MTIKLFLHGTVMGEWLEHRNGPPAEVKRFEPTLKPRRGVNVVLDVAPGSRLRVRPTTGVFFEADADRGTVAIAFDLGEASQ